MKAKLNVAAILTGDIVNSTRLSPLQEKQLFELLRRFVAQHKYEFFRGDSFQIYIDDPRDALQMALVCRSLAIELTENGERYDVRISIGIGKVNLPIKDLGIASVSSFRSQF
jgi:class 3 adenylate cyclase